MLILYYHNVVDGPLDEFDRKLSRIHVDEFEEQMRQVAADFHPLSLEAMLRLLHAGQSDPKAIAVTFDDGYYGVIAHALPILKELRIPATIFVVTDFVRGAGRSGLLHFDDLELAFRLSAVEALDASFAGARVTAFTSAHARVDAMKRLKNSMKSRSDAERQQIHQRLLETLRVDETERIAYAQSEEKFRMASWDELRQSQGDGLSVGSHTCSHRVLSRLDQFELEHEIRASYVRLRKEITSEFVPFAYPYGNAASIGDMAPALVKAAGHSCALTTVSGRNTPATDPFLLRRIEFEALNWPF